MTITKEQVREAFERHWRKTRKDKKADWELTRHPLQPQTYTQDSANRHWITWDRAFHAGAEAKLAELLDAEATTYMNGFRKGAEAKLAELCEGVEMPEPHATLHHDDGYFTTKQREHDLRYSGPMRTDVVTLTQLQTAVAAAVAKERVRIETAAMEWVASGGETNLLDAIRGGKA